MMWLYMFRILVRVIAVAVWLALQVLVTPVRIVRAVRRKCVWCALPLSVTVWASRYWRAPYRCGR